jgi:hypothetical protein
MEVLAVTLQSAVQWAELAVFVLLAGVSVIEWLRRRGKAGAWLALTFAVLGTVVVAGQFISPSQTGVLVDWVRKGLIVVLLLFPYCLYRFTGVFWGRSPRTDRMAGITTSLVAVATLSLPRFVPPGQPLPPWLSAYALLLLADWTVLSSIAVARLWLCGKAQATVARRRMQTHDGWTRRRRPARGLGGNGLVHGRVRPPARRATLMAAARRDRVPLGGG